MIEQISACFDAGYYLRIYPDVAESQTDPLCHFLNFGANEWRSPHPLFDASYYVKNNPDIDFGKVDPFTHFIGIGGAEKRNPHPLFDSKFYYQQYQELMENEFNPLIHFLIHGAKEKLNPHPLFDTAYYYSRYPDAEFSGLNPLVHYLEYGAEAGLNPSPGFDVEFYVRQNPDVSESGMKPLCHYAVYGKAEDRLCCNEFIEQNIDSLCKFYPVLKELEPLLPPECELSKLPLRKSLRKSLAGDNYFKLAEAIDIPFTHLILMGELSCKKCTESGSVGDLARSLPGASLLVISADPGAKINSMEIASRFPYGTRCFGPDCFADGLTLPERLSIVARFILQASPKIVYNYHSQIGEILFCEYAQQLSLSSCLQDCSCFGSRSDESTFNNENAMDEPCFDEARQITSCNFISDEEFDISLVIICHAEGELLSRTISAAAICMENARRAKLKTEYLFVLDNPDSATRSVIDRCSPNEARIIETAFSDPGMARNLAAMEAGGKFIAVQDGDDLLSPNWLLEAYKFARVTDSENVVLHPFGTIFFGETEMINVYFDSDDSSFSRSALMEDSVWITNGFARRSLFLAHPYSPADYRQGFDFEDWQWNCDTVASGVVHKMVPNTFFCYRVKSPLASKNARAHSCLLGKSKLFALKFQAE